MLELPCSTLPTRGRLEHNHDPARTALRTFQAALERGRRKKRRRIIAPRLRSDIVPTSAGELKGLQNICFGSLPAISVLSRSISRRGRRATALGRDGPKADSCSGSKKDRYSITSSASSKNDSRTDRPSALAVFRLTTSSYFSGDCTGRSAGASPFRMRLTYELERRRISAVSGP